MYSDPLHNGSGRISEILNGRVIHLKFKESEPSLSNTRLVETLIIPVLETIENQAFLFSAVFSLFVSSSYSFSWV